MFINQSSFTGGEISPKLYARSNLDPYKNSVAELENFMIWAYGGVERRPGTRFSAEVKDSSKNALLVPFKFGTTQSYILEFGDLYMRVYKDYGQVLDATGAIYEIATPYTKDDLQYIKYEQSFDKMWIVTGKHKPKVLARTGHAAWTLTDFAPTNDPFTSATMYPRTVIIYSQRIWFGGTIDKPQTLWSSKTSSYYDFSVSSPVVDTDAITFTIDAGQTNSIYWLEQYRDGLTIGTSNSLWRMFSSDSSKAIASTTIKVERVNATGSANIQGRFLSSAVLFVDSSTKNLHELAYDFSSDSYQTPYMTLLAEHITGQGVTQFAWQGRPNQILWAVRKDGTLLGFTYMRDQKVMGWHRHQIGGGGLVESVASIPRADASQDDIFIVVKRTINGVTKRYVEFIDASEIDLDSTEWGFMDCALTYKGASTSNISGLSHLEGMEVTVFADGSTHPNRTVTGGSISLQKPASTVTVGLAYTSKLKTLKAEINPIQTSQGKQKVIHSVTLDCYKSLSGKVGCSLDAMDAIFETPTTTAPTAKSDYKQILWNGSWDKDGQIYVVQDQPFPLNIRNIQLNLNFGER